MNSFEEDIESQDEPDTHLSIQEDSSAHSLLPQVPIRVVSVSDLGISSEIDGVHTRGHLPGLSDVNQVYTPDSNHQLDSFGLTVLSGLESNVGDQEGHLVQMQVESNGCSRTSGKKKPDTQVIEVLVYNDIINCGMCGKQYVDILEFMEHKSQHTISNSVHRCELCKEIYLQHEILLEHYRKYHGLTNFGAGLGEPTEDMNINTDMISHPELQQNGSNMTNGDEELSDVATNGMEEDTSETLFTKRRVSSTPKVASKVINGTSHHKGNVSILKKEPGKFVGTKRKNISAGKQDFHFILATEAIKGGSLKLSAKTKFQCLHCEFKTLSKIAISKHMHDKHKQILLSQGTYQEGNVDDKRRVMKMSTYEKENPEKSVVAPGQSRYRRTETRDIPGVYACDQCDKIFTRLRYLRKHKETHRTDKKFLCDECGKSFKCKTYLTVHRRIHKTKLFKCNQCDFTSRVNAAIHAHRQIHNQGSVLCDICGYAYIDKSTLAKHKRVHDLSRPFACNFPGCAWRFKTEIMCKAHIRAHTTKGKFQCSFCGYVFRHKHHLQRHEVKLHGVKPDKNKQPTSTLPIDAQPVTEEIQDAISLIIKPDFTEDEIQLSSIVGEQVVMTDAKGTPIVARNTDDIQVSAFLSTILMTNEENQVFEH